MSRRLKIIPSVLKDLELAHIATNLSNGIVYTDSNGLTLWCNKSFEKITGYSMSELCGKYSSEVLRIPHFFEKEVERMLRGSHIIKEKMEVCHYRKSGELFWLLVESTPIYDENNIVTNYIEVCTEITRQKNIELAHKKSEENFEQISATIDDVFYLYNMFEQCYEYISYRTIDVFGVAPDYFYNNHNFIDEVVLPEDSYILRKGRLEAKNNRDFSVEYRIRINGEIRWIHERGFPIADENNEVRKVSGICADITDEKKTRETINRQNRDIAESIEYAKLIQEATLPNKDDLNKLFPNSFVFYQPKETLSGDFYLAESIRARNGKKLLGFVVADCTGHGVPGAILSILCNSLIKQTLSNHEVHSPADALDVVKRQITRLFRSSSSTTINDGMDIGFCVINPDERKLHFSGANFSCFILRKSEWIVIKGDKLHVGYSDLTKSFTNNEFEYQSKDKIYLFTDGFTDQFGGERNKKYMKRQLLDFLKGIEKYNLNIQGKLVQKEFENWKGEQEQTDDVCILGLEMD
ncbi:MAG: PAS domain S-box protein [Crocinitomicaceae bacterium]|nr:PAS domain S-box protein [Crocinitomicaceae bacterium]